VENALEGRHESLKERIIGVEVFGRKPSYQTEADSVVRVRATEVRKRLSQYYAVGPQIGPYRIEIPPGSYVPQFRMGCCSPAEPEVVPVPPAGSPSDSLRTPSRTMPRWMGAVMLFLLVIAILMLTVFRSSAAHPAEASVDRDEKQLESFWKPAMLDPKSVLICIGSPTTYTYTGAYQGAWVREHGIDPDSQTQWTIGPQNRPIPGDAIMPVRSEYVGAGDANLAVLISALFSRMDKATEFRLSEETSYSEISDAPTVLIGGFSNRWTMANLSQQPFGFAQRGVVRLIEERDGQRRQWAAPHLRADGKTNEDFAIVSRLLDSETGKFLVSAAGISSFGSRAAGYFLTRPELLARALDQAPANWQKKNIQFVLKTKVVDNAPTAPEVVAWRVW
jgi:hypothetical protein